MAHIRVTVVLLLSVWVLVWSHKPALGARVPFPDKTITRLAEQLPYNYCHTCLWMVSALDDLLSDPRATDFLVELFQIKLCPFIPDVEKCGEYANALLPVVAQWLRTSASPAQRCAGTGVCGPKLLGDPFWDRSHVRPLHDGMECKVCKAAVTEARASAPTSLIDGQPVITPAVVSAACSKLAAGELSSSCSATIASYGPLLRLLASTQSDAGLACQLVGACVEPWARYKLLAVPAALMTQVAAAGPAVSAAYAQLKAALEQPRADVERCKACQQLVSEVSVLFKSPTFVDMATLYVDALCDTVVSAQAANQCRQIVDRYAPILFDLLAERATPKAVCSMLHICSGSGVRVAASLRRLRDHQ